MWTNNRLSVGNEWKKNYIIEYSNYIIMIFNSIWHIICVLYNSYNILEICRNVLKISFELLFWFWCWMWDISWGVINFTVLDLMNSVQRLSRGLIYLIPLLLPAQLNKLILFIIQKIIAEKIIVFIPLLLS